MRKILFITLLSLASPLCADETTQISTLANDFIQNNQVPGLSIAAYYAGQPHYFSFGVANRATQQPITPHTIFEIGSVTKTFTATVLSMQIQNGKIKLNDPIGPYLPPALQIQNKPINQITFEQLATHTAGLPTDPSNFVPQQPYGTQEFINFLAEWKPVYPPGTHWQYSNAGFGVLGYALAGLTAENFWQLLQTQLLQPLAMNNTAYVVATAEQNNYAQGYYLNNQPAPRWVMTAWKPSAGALRSTAADMMKFLQANLNVGDAPLSIRQAMQFAQQSYFKMNDHTMQDLAWATTITPQGQKIIWKNGATAGFSTFIALDPQQTAGVVIMTNKKTKAGELMKFTKSLFAAIKNK